MKYTVSITGEIRFDITVEAPADSERDDLHKKVMQLAEEMTPDDWCHHGLGPVDFDVDIEATPDSIYKADYKLVYRKGELVCK